MRKPSSPALVPLTPPLLTVEDAAQVLKVSRSKMYELIHRRTVNRYGADAGYVVSEPKNRERKTQHRLPSFVRDLLQHHLLKQKEIKAQAGETWQSMGWYLPAILARFFIRTGC